MHRSVQYAPGRPAAQHSAGRAVHERRLVSNRMGSARSETCSGQLGRSGRRGAGKYGDDRSAAREATSTSLQNPSPVRFRHSRPSSRPAASTTARRRCAVATRCERASSSDVSGVTVRPWSLPTLTAAAAGSGGAEVTLRSARVTVPTNRPPETSSAMCTCSSASNARTSSTLAVAGNVLGVETIASTTTPHRILCDDKPTHLTMICAALSFTLALAHRI